MSNIRYICLSDMHLGEEDSILTNIKANGEADPTIPSDVMKHLVECMKFLIKKNENGKLSTLILNGDILELALTSTDKAAMTFMRFIELTMKKEDELFKDILFIPGNHDHHLWETARETQYVNHVGNTEPNQKLEQPRHTTNLFLENQKIKVPSLLLTNLIQRFEHLKEQNKEINVFYPNFGLKSQDGKKCVILTHGHYFESMYKLMSTIKGMFFPKQKRSLNINELEAENFAWIDFFWSTMGRSGQFGKDVEFVYEKLQYINGRKAFIEDLSKSLAERFDLPGWGDWMEARIVKFLANKLTSIFANRERKETGSVLSSKVEIGLREYIDNPLYHQIKGEIKPLPEDVTIVFGHTHKPFQKDMKDFVRYPEWINVYNTGGWVVETIDPEPIHGASMVLIDEDLNTTSINMYKEKKDYSPFKVSVNEARHGSEKSNPFYEEIAKLVDPNQEPWKSFSEVTSATVKERAENLDERAKKWSYVD